MQRIPSSKGTSERYTQEYSLSRRATMRFDTTSKPTSPRLRRVGRVPRGQDR
jgi:hypothetical protein